MNEDNKLIDNAFKEWRKEHPDAEAETAFFAGARFVINYLIEKGKI